MALKSLFGSIKRPAEKAVRAGINKDRSLKSQGVPPKKAKSKMVNLKKPSPTASPKMMDWKARS